MVCQPPQLWVLRPVHGSVPPPCCLCAPLLVQVLSWAQLTLGFALPLLILDWDRWRRKLEGWPPVRRALEPVMLSPVVLLQYTGLFAVACKVGWQWVELALLRAR